jgi:hypothetical protein
MALRYDMADEAASYQRAIVNHGNIQEFLGQQWALELQLDKLLAIDSATLVANEQMTWRSLGRTSMVFPPQAYNHR